MGSGGSSSQSQASRPGTLSPVTATLLSLFGGNPQVRGGQFQPTGFGGGAFNPNMFANLTGLLQNQPLSGVEQFLLGTGAGNTTSVPRFDQAGFNAAANAARGTFTPAQGRFGRGQWTPGGPMPNPQDFMTMETTGAPGGFGQQPGFQDLALAAALQSQGLLEQGAGTLPALLETNPSASIAAARRGFTEETIPAILERAPGFSSTDLQRELTRAGTDLETNIAALKEANLGRVGQVVQGLPAFASAVGGNLLEQASQILGFGQLGRDLVRETSPAGDAFRVLTALQALTGPGLVSTQQGKQSQANASFLK